MNKIKILWDDMHLPSLQSPSIGVSHPTYLDQAFWLVDHIQHNNQRLPQRFLWILPNDYVAYDLTNILKAYVKGHKNDTDSLKDQGDQVSNFHQNKDSIVFIPSSTTHTDYYPAHISQHITQDASIKNNKDSYALYMLIKSSLSMGAQLALTSLKTYVQLNFATKNLQKQVNIQQGQTYDFAAMSLMLINMGYERTPILEEYGTFVMRGDILEILSVSYEKPLRIHFFDNLVERIEFFYLGSHETDQILSTITLYPNASLEHHRLLDQSDNTSKSITSSGTTSGSISSVEKSGKTLFECLKSNHVVLYGDILHDLQHYGEQIHDIAENNPDQEESLDNYASTKVLRQEWEQGLCWVNNTHANKSLDALQVGNPLKNVMDALNHHDRNHASHDFKSTHSKSKTNMVFPHLGLKILLVCEHEVSKDRLLMQCREQHLPKPTMVQNLHDFIHHPNNTLGVMVLPLTQNFQSPTLWIVADLYGKKHHINKQPKRFREHLDLSLLQNEDLVVHIDYGIGQFLGLQSLLIDKISQDFFVLQFDKDDKLYVPVLNSDKIYRFGTMDSHMILDSLRHSTWSKRYGKAIDKMTLMAKDLMESAAKRKLIKSQVMDVPYEQYEQFLKTFPYVETADQYKAEQNILVDLTKDHPMDRLVCGDAGYGKTEIALRATAAVTFAGYQVLLVVPTTLLAWQHFQIFKKRFADYPDIHIALYTSNISASTRTKIKQRLQDHTVSVVIGTSGLFSNIAPKKPGLLIIDEEQNFGVKQKEKLRAVYPSIHTLSISATPIPRTLQLAISGIKDLSLITTPPQNRETVRTSLLHFNDPVIFDAIEFEKKRGGQIFCVSPKIEWLERIYDMLISLDKGLNIIIAHGRMPSHKLEKNMQAFLNKDYDVLLSTNIIESGLDIANANSIFIFYADRFGLAQLYQLRGRVGRSQKQGYCYFVTEKTITDAAKKRLNIVQNLEFSGSSFTLSSEDLDMRGMGNMVGKEQSGIITGLGIELYQSMLVEAVERQKTSNNQAYFIPSVDIKADAYIPSDYIADPINRTQIYRQLAKLATQEQVHEFALSMEARYGPSPMPVMILFALMDIKDMCKKTFVSAIEGGMKGVRISFYQNTFPKGVELLHTLQNHPTLSITSGQKLLCKGDWDDAQALIHDVKDILMHLQSLLNA